MNYLSSNVQKKEWLNLNCNSVIADTQTVSKQFLIGEPSDNAVMTSTGVGTFCAGESVGSLSALVSSGNGSFLSGRCITTGEMFSSGNGSLVHGSCDSGGKISSAASGAHANGYCSGSDSHIFSNDLGSFSGGVCSGNVALIEADGAGSMCYGFARSDGKLESGVDGSFVFGYVNALNELTKTFAKGSMLIGRDIENVSANEYSLGIGLYGKSKAVSAGTRKVDGKGSFSIIGGSAISDTDGLSVMIGTEQTFFGNAPQGGGVADFWQASSALKSTFFETNDAILLKEDPIGTFVKLENGKLSICENDDDQPIGVISDKTGLISDTKDFRWKKSVLLDKFGRKIIRSTYLQPIKNILKKYNIEIDEIIKETIRKDTPQTKYEICKILQDRFQKIDIFGQRKLKTREMYEDLLDCCSVFNMVENLDYDQSLEYIPRASRKEWMPVAFDCKVPVKCSSDISVGDMVSIESGEAILGDKYHVIEKDCDDVCTIFFK